MNQWFVVRDGREVGPLSAQQLKELASKGRLRPADLVRREGMSSPRSARDIKGLPFLGLPIDSPAAEAGTPPGAPPPLPTDTPAGSPSSPIERTGGPVPTASKRPVVIAFAAVPCVLGLLLTLSLLNRASRNGDSPAGGRVADAPVGADGSGEEIRGPGGVRITHAPWTSITMPDLPKDRVRAIDFKGKSPPHVVDSNNRPVVSLADVNFMAGPGGEPIEREYHDGSAGMRMEGYFYMKPEGKVLHGPYRTWHPDGQLKYETGYIYGAKKYEQEFDMGVIETEVYRGDDDHTKVRKHFYDDGSPKLVEHYVITHAVSATGDELKAVPHGISEKYHDNTLAKRQGRGDWIGGLMSRHEFDHGRLGGGVVFDRQGNVINRFGRGR